MIAKEHWKSNSSNAAEHILKFRECSFLRERVHESDEQSPSGIIAIRVKVRNLLWSRRVVDFESSLDLSRFFFTRVSLIYITRAVVKPRAALLHRLPLRKELSSRELNSSRPIIPRVLSKVLSISPLEEEEEETSFQFFPFVSSERSKTRSVKISRRRRRKRRRRPFRLGSWVACAINVENEVVFFSDNDNRRRARSVPRQRRGSAIAAAVVRATSFLSSCRRDRPVHYPLDMAPALIY